MKKTYFLLSAVMLISLGLVGLIKGGLLSAADDPNKTFALKPAPVKTGDKERIIFKMEASAAAKFPTMPNHVATGLYSKMERDMEQKFVDVDSDTGEIIKIERTYKSSKVFLSKTSSAGKADVFDQKTLYLDNMNEIQLKNPPKEKDPKKANPITDEMKQVMSIDENNFRLILPPDEVKTGDKWEVNQASALRLFNFANSRKRPVHHGCTEIGINSKFTQASLTCTLKEIKKVKPAKDNCAVIELAGNLKGNDNGLNIDISFAGTAVFDLKKAKFLKAEGKGTLSMKGSQPCTKTAAQGDVDGTGELKFSVEFK